MMVYNEKQLTCRQAGLLASKTTARVSIKRRKPGKLPHGKKKILNIYFLNIKPVAS
jgi:hypothetical protein